MNTSKMIELIKKDAEDLYYLTKELEEDNVTNSYLNLCLSKTSNIANAIKTLIDKSSSTLKQKQVAPSQNIETDKVKAQQTLPSQDTETDEKEQQKTPSTKKKEPQIKTQIILEEQTPKLPLYETLTSKINTQNKYPEKDINDLKTTLSQQPIKDITEVIGINDKFSFVRELFGGDAQKYDKIINNLNTKKNIEEATDYITENIEIDEKNQKTFEILIDIITRRYS